MKFKQFINEASKEDMANDVFDNLLRDIKKDCGPFLNDSYMPIYRGRHGLNTWKKEIARDNRLPKDSAEDMFFNNIFNMAIEEISGIPEIRKKALFCTRDYSQAYGYGNVCYVFPIGKPNFIYGNRVYDSYDDVSSYALRKAIMKSIGQPFNKKGPITSILDYAANEYGVDVQSLEKLFDKVDIEKVLKALKETFTDEFGYVVTDNVTKMEKDKSRLNGEIMLVGSPAYYVVNVNYAAKWLDMSDDDSAKYVENVYRALADAAHEI